MIVSSHDLNFNAGRQVMLSDTKTPSVPLGSMNDWALSQMETKLDAPGQRWLNDPAHCPDELQASILDYLTAVRPEMQLMTRLKGDQIRAVLSDQYTPFDNNDLLDLVVAAVTTNHYEPEVHRFEVGDNLRAYILLPQITFANDTPDKYGDGGLHPAVYVRNSEIGNGMVRITSAIYRHVCGNGVIFGWQEEESMSLRHRWIKKSMMGMMIMDSLASALKMSEEATALFIKSQETHLSPRGEKFMDNLVNGWGDKYGLTVEAKENWLSTITSEATAYGRKDDPRLFDVINAATYVAQNRSTDEREQMERMAGDLLVPHTSVREL